MPPQILKHYPDAIIYEDAGKSGKNNNRPQLQQLIDDTEKNDLIVATKIDRLGRTVKGGLEVIETIINKGANIITLDGIMNAKADNPSDRLQINLLLAIAEWERGTIIERTQTGMARAKANGVKFGRPEKVKDRKLITKLS